MKDLKEAVKTAQKEALRTGNKYSVFKQNGEYRVAGSKSKDEGKKVGTAVPMTIFGNTVVRYFIR